MSVGTSTTSSPRSIASSSAFQSRTNTGAGRVGRSTSHAGRSVQNSVKPSSPPPGGGPPAPTPERPVAPAARELLALHQHPDPPALRALERSPVDPLRGAPDPDRDGAAPERPAPPRRDEDVP